MVVLGSEIPYARMILARLRDTATGLREFRYWLRQAGRLLAFHVSKELAWSEKVIQTPLAEARELDLKEQPLLVNILGAGEFLVHGFLDVYPNAPLAFVAARRIEREGGVTVEFTYSRMPSSWGGITIIVDPMLATGTTVRGVAEHVLSMGSRKVVVASVISAPEGIKRVSQGLEDKMVIYTLAVDRGLNDRFFIVPGLGDAGDRSLGVVPG